MNKLQKLTNDADVGTSNLPSATLGDINILIGINGGGKTTLLESIYRQIKNGQDCKGEDANICFLRDGDSEGELVTITSAWHSIIDEKGRYLSDALELIQSVYPNVLDLFIFDDDQMLYAGFTDNQIYFEDMGAGFISLIRIIASVWLASNGYLLIDNLGRGLHIDSSSDVSEFIINNAAKDNTQVFISTHCPSCLSAFNNRDDSSGIETKLVNVKSAYQMLNHVVDAEILKF